MTQADIARLADVSRSDVCNFIKGRLTFVSPEKTARIRKVLTGASQNTVVEMHLETVGTITQAQSIKLYSIYRLSARVYDLNKRYARLKQAKRIVNLREGNTGMGNFAEYKMEESK